MWLSSGELIPKQRKIPNLGTFSLKSKKVFHNVVDLKRQIVIGEMFIYCVFCLTFYNRVLNCFKLKKEKILAGMRGIRLLLYFNTPSCEPTLNKKI